ncbi:Sulfatase [Novipirellula artificiosorum]|uniref:Sulfatase n=1 Tax=Novipirellula artificiosorum TaxID=2528016 RepID=A0A5C6DZ82_9BACT|nr:Sulfatase [Novipirellula artificiosorum]
MGKPRRKTEIVKNATLAIFVALSAGAVYATDAERPNILWLTSEDNSAEWLGCYGNVLAKTPHINQLAREGFRYTNVFANIPVCSPTRGSWITGVHALSLGIQPMRSSNEIPHDRIPYYPDLLAARGYFTGNSTKTDFNIGGRSDGDCWDHQGKVAWEKLPERQPFFQVVNSTTSHESRAHGQVEKTRCNPDDVVVAKYHPDIPQIRKNYAKYYDAVENMDKEIGASLAKLEELGLADNTIVIHNSDHGGVMPRSKRFLFNNSIHCPLIVRIPERYKHLWPAEKPGMTVDRLVAFIDMPKTWMSLTGAEIPSHMQGTIFLGPGTEPEDEFSFGYSERQGDVLDDSRSVRGKRYYYIKRYMPFVPWGQFASYTWKMEATRAWEAHHKAGLTDEITGRFFLPKPHSEELYDTQTDPDCIHNLIDDPRHAERITRMRGALRSWQEEVHDSGLLPEEERAKRAADNGVTIYDMVRDPKLYDLPAYLDAADLAIAGEAQNLPRLAELLKHEDAGVRYWAVTGCLILQDEAKPIREEILALADDQSHEVRAVAAYHLFQIGEKELALLWLGRLLESQTYASMKTLSVIYWIGEEARPLLPAIEKLKPEGKYTVQRQAVVLDRFAGKR